MDRDGQVLFQIRDKRWIIRGIKMNRAQTKRQIEQQISEMKARESKPTTRVSTEDVSARDTLYKKECTRVEKAISSSLPGMNSRKSECYYLVDWPINDIICLESR
jgi:hypothetical protein